MLVCMCMSTFMSMSVCGCTGRIIELRKALSKVSGDLYINIYAPHVVKAICECACTYTTLLL